jgi:hypothetical protein
MSALDKLSQMTVNLTFNDTANKDYNKLQAYRNVTSYSILNELHSCPRKFLLIKNRAASGAGQAANVDFAMGHSVGSGIQAWLASGGDMTAAIFNAFLAWNISFNAAIPTKRKSIWEATLAVEKYALFHTEQLDDWQVWTMPNGKPAIELSFSIDFENGYKHYGHIDTILQNKQTGKLAVQENKTSGFKSLEEAIYANSSQALGYAVLIDQLVDDTSFEVFYCVYSTPAQEWSLLPFTKSTSLKAEWINDVLLDHAALSTYDSISFYPKRGESCYAFMRRCEFFGSCNLTSHLPQLAELPMGEEAEHIDYAFTLSQIRARQHERNVE